MIANISTREVHIVLIMECELVQKDLKESVQNCHPEKSIYITSKKHDRMLRSETQNYHFKYISETNGIKKHRSWVKRSAELALPATSAYRALSEHCVTIICLGFYCREM
jgi:hypothetical protein